MRLGVALFAALLGGLRAQQPSPHIGYVFPAGGRQGSSFEVTVGGQFLDGVSKALVSGPGVQISIGEYIKPMTPGQANQLREKLAEIQKKRTGGGKWTREDEKTVAEIRMKLMDFVRRPPNPAIAEVVKLKVTVAPDAAPGDREIRLGANLGLTNPLVFRVGQLPERSKAPVKILADVPALQNARFRNAQRPPQDTLAEIELPAVLNGQIVPGGTDRYRFKAKQGQDLIVAASARELIPYISDAVPGWFQATLALYDANGREVDYAGNYRFHPDPVLHYRIPADGDYTLAVRDSIYRGREDFVYRITIGELPFVTGIFPLGGKGGSQTQVQLAGWNLPSAKLTEDARRKTPGVYPVSVQKDGWSSNRVPFAVDTLTDRLEKEPNNLAKNAQLVKLPLIVNGRVDQPGDTDVFKFQGRAGEEIVAEVFARRLDSPLDSILRLTDSSGRQLAVNDDSEDKGSGLLTHHADSRIEARLPRNGTYYLYLSDTQRKGGPEYAYRLHLRRPQPDFDLRIVPASLNVRGGGTVPVTVYALRHDGFGGEISLRLKDAPGGFLLDGGRIPAGQDKVRLTLTVPPGNWDEPLSLHMEGRAAIQGREVVKAGVPAEDMMQAFAYRHLVPARDWMVYVARSGRFRPPWKLDAGKTVKVPTDGTAPIKLSVVRWPGVQQVQFELNQPPEGIAIEKVASHPGGLDILLKADAGKIKPGLKGNLIVDAFAVRAGSGKQAGTTRRQPIGVLPAIPFEVVGPETRR